MRRQQLRQAKVLLGFAQQTVPFYRDRLTQAGFEPGQDLTEEAWARLPILTRAEVQEAGERLYSTQVPKAHGATYELSTSGSTGRPIKAKGTALMQVLWDALTLREHLWQRRDFAAKLVAIRSYASGVADYPKGSLSPSWGRSLNTTFGSGPSAALHIGTKIEDQVEWLQRQEPEYFLTYPSALREILLYSRRAGLRFPKLRQVRTLSELLTPETRELCREVWGLEIADLYSTQENGYLAFQCSEQGAYHVQSEVAILEVLNDSGAPCGPGEIGRVVVTSLHNFAMPLIRYAVGDLAEVGEPCSCGRGLPVLNRILGRVRNVLVYPDGRKAWALLGDMYYTEIPDIRQFQIIQRTVQDIEIKLVVERPLTAAEEDEVRGWFHERSGYRFTVAFTYHDEIPRSANGKFEDFRSEVAELQQSQPFPTS